MKYVSEVKVILRLKKCFKRKTMLTNNGKFGFFEIASNLEIFPVRLLVHLIFNKLDSTSCIFKEI